LLCSILIGIGLGVVLAAHRPEFRPREATLVSVGSRRGHCRFCARGACHRGQRRHTATAAVLAGAMSVFGTKRTWQSRSSMSAFGGKADITQTFHDVCF
jgi:hypothetical protein